MEDAPDEGKTEKALLDRGCESVEAATLGEALASVRQSGALGPLRSASFEVVGHLRFWLGMMVASFLLSSPLVLAGTSYGALAGIYSVIVMFPLMAVWTAACMSVPVEHYFGRDSFLSKKSRSTHWALRSARVLGSMLAGGLVTGVVSVLWSPLEASRSSLAAPVSLLTSLWTLLMMNLIIGHSVVIGLSVKEAVLAGVRASLVPTRAALTLLIVSQVLRAALNWGALYVARLGGWETAWIDAGTREIAAQLIGFSVAAVVFTWANIGWSFVVLGLEDAPRLLSAWDPVRAERNERRAMTGLAMEPWEMGEGYRAFRSDR